MAELKVDELIKFIRRVAGNRGVRFILKRLGRPKEVTKLLGIYAGIEEPSTTKEKGFAYIISTILERLAAKFGVDEQSLKEGLKDPYIRRGIANILLGIAYYGVTRPQKLYAPFMVVWDFTKQCNLMCKHCYANASPFPAQDELTLDEKLGVLRQLDEAGVAALSFSGGEPLINKDFWVIARKAAEAGMYVSVATNGVLIREDVAKKMKEIGVRYVEISLDSPYPDVHNEFRGVPNAWERSVQGVKNAKAVGLETGIAFTVTKLNYKQLPEMLKLSKELGVDRFIAFNFIPTGRGRDIIELDLSPEERIEVLELLYSELSSGNIQAFSTSPFYAVISLRHIDSGGRLAPTHFADLSIPEEYIPAGYALAEFLGGCGAGRIYCSIEHNGDIQPCVFLPIVVGNVLRDGFLNVWHNSPLMRRLRDRDNYACSFCEYRYICGGCRARAYAYYGDPLGPDPSCDINKDLWEDLLTSAKAHVQAWR